MEPLTLPVHTLFMELHEMTAHLEARRRLGFQNGFFRRMKKRGIVSHYFVFPRALDARCVYIGGDAPALKAFIERFRAGRQEASTRRVEIGRLAKMLKGAGINHLDVESFRVIDAFADGGIFRLGGVLVGTHAFNAIGNALGVRWQGTAIRTQDVDFAKGRVKFAGIKASGDIQKLSVPERLERLEMGLTPVPALDFKSPSTSFSNARGFRVDFLVPLVGKEKGPCFIADFNVAAKPLRFLDYLIEETFETSAVSGAGSVLVTVPQPARFAFHKLIVAGNRSLTEEAKAVKDIHQAEQLFQVLLERRPDDLPPAFAALHDRSKQRGAGWLKHLRKGLARMEPLDKKLAERLRRLLAM